MTISQWYKPDGRIEIGYWVIDGDNNFELTFVGSRPLNRDINEKDLFLLIRIGQKILDEYSDELKNEDGYVK